MSMWQDCLVLVFLRKVSKLQSSTNFNYLVVLVIVRVKLKETAAFRYCSSGLKMLKLFLIYFFFNPDVAF